jgi:hypothetical protein
MFRTPQGLLLRKIAGQVGRSKGFHAFRIRVRFSRITMANARKLCLSAIWKGLNEALGHLGDAIRVREQGTNHRD